MTECKPDSPSFLLLLHRYAARSLGNSTNLTVENGRDKCVYCAWEGCLARFLFVIYVASGGGGGDGGFFAAIELIDHLLFPAAFKEVNSMGSGDNGKPHKARTRRDMGTDLRKEVERSYITWSPFTFCSQSGHGGVETQFGIPDRFDGHASQVERIPTSRQLNEIQTGSCGAYRLRFHPQRLVRRLGKRVGAPFLSHASMRILTTGGQRASFSTTKRAPVNS
ncbi:hypothetical protein X777_06177 [Ooceraea biroi]|uniref:Uncharacterized protein n=1 Tax=Ooceraea biroi TaxID=2015173 RepID=A0A026WE08_OOCBI|nr:hypothetical protein X777_06177 [Ooceraea biroi]